MIFSRPETPKMKVFKSKAKYIYPPFITICLGLFIFAVKGIYPFGVDTVDYYDLSAQISAFYYHIWDTLHGSKIYFFDWYTALGTNMSVASSGSGFFSVFNLFFLFVKRDCLMESLSFFLLMKMALMSLTMYVCIHKLFSTPRFVELIASVGYGFCGFVLMHYTIINWLDLAIFAPLIIYYAIKLLREGKIKGFIITLSLGFIHNYYLSFILLLFLFLETGLYSAIFSHKSFESSSEYKPRLLKLGLCVVASAGISAVITLPQILQTLSSSRISNNSSSLIDTYLLILSESGGYTTRWWTLFGLSFSAACIFIGLIRDLKNKKYDRFLWIFGSLFIVLIPLLFENVNLIWHFGSYVHYPIRFGFLLYFTIAASLCSYSTELFEEKHTVSFGHKSWHYLLLVVSLALFYLGYRWYSNNPGMSISKVLHVTLLSMGLAFFVYLLLFIFKKGKFIQFSIIIWISELLFYSLLTIGTPTYITGINEEPEQEKASVQACTQLFHDFALEENHIARVKNPDESLNANYGFYLRQPVLSNWTHVISPGLQSGAGRLGYSWQFTRLLDAGGTVFSDALLNVDRLITNQEQDEKLYSLSKSTTVSTGSKYYLYDCNFDLPFGMIINSSDDISAINSTGNIVDLYNALYRATIQSDSSTVSDDSVSSFASFEGCSADVPLDYDEPIKLDILGKKALYFYGNCIDSEYRNVEILVNDEPITIPTIQDYNNTLYPAHFNNNAVYLGTFENESVTVTPVLKDNENQYECRLFSLDLNEFNVLCDSYNDYQYACSTGTHSLDYSLSGENGKYLLIPVAYSSGWKCKVNGQHVSPISVLDLFMAVPLNDGNNEIAMTYWPNGLFMGAIISVISLLLALLIIRKFEDTYFEKANKIINSIYIAGWSLVVVGMFVIPVCYTVISKGLHFLQR